MSSVGKAVIILDKLSQPPYVFSLGELSEAIDCTKSGTYKILAEMISANYVQRRNNKKYSLGCSILKLHNAYEKYALSWNTCRPFLEKLRNITGETSTLAQWENGRAHILYRVQSQENLRVEGNIGKSLPINASAHGKLLAAYQDESVIDALIKKEPLKKICPNTIVDINQLKAEYRLIRKSGVSISVEESSLGSIGIAAPIRGHNGEVCASICVGTPTARLTAEKRDMIIEHVTECAKSISALMLEHTKEALK